ncbi:thioredoxin-dependent thiol peroxidase [Kangiella sp. TOML190]|uniref:thioredoxin-dependent thiol peroxidase n=1 Tax=Kangiella sp. TOML190 TaxID=2931351 RepID=UPI00203E9CF5|nr:thioredoxin-dependent thiol peroxidase [Kangiella sp. TOML190]
MTSKIQLNKKAPNFSLAATGDQTLSLKDFKGKKLVIYFYPKDNTPGCTTEGQNFRDLYPQFQKLNTEILGVSRDTVRVHENFKNKHEFPFELLSDGDEAMCNAYEVIKLKKLYGREYMGIERSTFLIDESGKLRQEWRKVKVKEHAQEVLEAVKSL